MAPRRRRPSAANNSNNVTNDNENVVLLLLISVMIIYMNHNTYMNTSNTKHNYDSITNHNLRRPSAAS